MFAQPAASFSRSSFSASAAVSSLSTLLRLLQPPQPTLADSSRQTVAEQKARVPARLPPRLPGGRLRLLRGSNKRWVGWAETICVARGLTLALDLGFAAGLAAAGLAAAVLAAALAAACLAGCRFRFGGDAGCGGCEAIDSPATPAPVSNPIRVLRV